MLRYNTTMARANNLLKGDFMQKNTGTKGRQSNRCKRRVKQSRKKWIFQWVCIMFSIACALFLGQCVGSAWDKAPEPSSSATEIGSGSGVAENAGENDLATAREHEDEQAWSLILVNKHNAIPDEYDVELEQLSNGEWIDIRIYPALQDLFDAARADGVYPIVASGYRTAEKQQNIMDKKIAEYKAKGYSHAQAQAEAELWVAIPGTSEHQLGIGVDINADGIYSKGSEVYEWLAENGYRFGFIRRYPPDKTEITGVSDEPWHYRYVGIPAATEMYHQNLCLEEYMGNR